MKIEALHIRNFKSIVDMTIEKPNPFTVFVGANGVGKSNIFEAMEFLSLMNSDLFGGPSNYLNRNAQITDFSIRFKVLDSDDVFIDLGVKSEHEIIISRRFNDSLFNRPSRIFIGNLNVEKQNLRSDKMLSTSCSNLEKVLGRLLLDEVKREEIHEWLDLFIPEFTKVEINQSGLTGKEELAFFQKGYERPFDRELISDGTYNILCLLTAVLQSDKPQFLCIEEPENGLNPYVIRKLVDFFRQACEEQGHYIWLNTHSQTLVENLTLNELILVDKIDGATQIKQFDDFNQHGLDLGELWLSGGLGGGIPW